MVLVCVSVYLGSFTCLYRPMSRECHPARGHLFEGAGLFATCNQFSTVLTSVIDFIHHPAGGESIFEMKLELVGGGLCPQTPVAKIK